MEPQPPQPRILPAGDNESGVACPHCLVQIQRGDPVAQCPACATVHHEGCWRTLGGCGSYGCAPARRTASADMKLGDVLRISDDDLDRAIPLPPPREPFAPTQYATPIPTRKPVRSTVPGKTSALAIAALICAIVGIPLFGLLTGAIAMILAALAISSIQSNQLRGMPLAMIGLCLGFLDIAGWLIAIILWQGPAGPPALRQADIDMDPASLATVDPNIAAGMRANVVITSGGGLGERMGSGVVLKIDKGFANIVTNRHVIDGSFSQSGSNSDKPNLDKMLVRMLGQTSTEAKLLWVAPGGIDLAIISVDCRSNDVRAAKYPALAPPKLGDPVFAIGNPQALSWSFSPGSISQFRVIEEWGHALPVIQTSAPINSGNSGGGLYDKSGHLIGINTWTEDKRISEGLGFAISLNKLIELAPRNLLSPVGTTTTTSATTKPADHDARTP